MITLLAVVLWIVVFAAIAVLHAAWGLGSHWPCESEAVLVRTAGGTPGATKMYPPASCFLVAALLAGVSVWPLFAVGLLPEAWPRWLTLLAGAGIALVFLGTRRGRLHFGVAQALQRGALRHPRPPLLCAAVPRPRRRLPHPSRSRRSSP